MSQDELDYFSAEPESDNDEFLEYAKCLFGEPEPVTLGNSNGTGQCGMCGANSKKLYPHRVGQVEFMICANCKGIMDMMR